jgi:hypothetical protein
VKGEGNHVSDFPLQHFTIRVFCDACGHQADLDRQQASESTAIQDLTRRLRCSAWGSRNTSIRIVYTGAGGFRHY